MGLMFIATPIFAQSVPTDTPPIQDQYVQALQTLIGLLQQQVALLVEQLQKISDNQSAISANQIALTAQVQQIAQGTQPVAPVFGSMPGQIVQTPTKIILTDSSSQSTNYGGNCSGLTVWAKVLDEYGNSIKNIPVIFTNPDTGATTSISTGVFPIGFGDEKNVSYAAFNFRPQQISGQISIPVTSGGLSSSDNATLNAMRDRYYFPDGSLNTSRARTTDDPNILVDVLTSNTFNLATNTCK